MAPSAAPGSKKRGRPRKDETNTDNSAKKPRLASPAVARTTATSSLRSLSSAISKSFALGLRKVSSSGSLGRGKESTDKIYDIPDSEEEKQKPRDKHLNAGSNLSAKRADSGINGVYDFHGSDEEPSSAQAPSKRRKATASTGQTSPTTSKPSALAARGKALKAASKASSRRARGGSRNNASRASSRTVSRSDEQAEASEDTEHGVGEVSDSEDMLNTPSAMRTGLKKGAPLSKTNGTTPKLKGILTPSRRLSERSSKNVAFDEPSKKTDEIFFADLPNKSVKVKSIRETQPSGKENKPVKDIDGPDSETLQEEEEEEEVCVICSKPESKPPNEILFCDGCDMAVHQKCYGVAKIPKGDWLCKDCSQTTSIATDVVEPTASLGAIEAMPKIPNFEQHLRRLQRTLLDRCTGKRRIKLCGQDEAYEKTFQLVDQTVMAGEGNSMLIIGARGCGKTTVSLPRPGLSDAATDQCV